MTIKQAMEYLAKKFNEFKKTALDTENKYFSNNKGMYHQDVTQDLYLKIYEELEKTKEEPTEIFKLLDRYTKSKTYLYQSIKQLLIDNFRRDKKYVSFDKVRLNENEKSKLVEMPKDLVGSKEKKLSDQINDYVKTFYWFDKKLFNVWRYDFKTHTGKMSKKTKISISTIYRTVRRTKILIKNKFKDQYYEK
tara:strand:+ start:609 stop:1184 length:576 start_codon:yes stop_codon:yes gene_type:complete